MVPRIHQYVYKITALSVKVTNDSVNFDATS